MAVLSIDGKPIAQISEEYAQQLMRLASQHSGYVGEQMTIDRRFTTRPLEARSDELTPRLMPPLITSTVRMSLVFHEQTEG